MFSHIEGETAVKAARHIIDAKVKGNEYRVIHYPSKFDQHSGVFVSINEYPSGDLRGCIGYLESPASLKQTLKKAAEGVINDSRFHTLSEDELDRITVEVTLLTPPVKIDCDNPGELESSVTCGVDGLIISKGSYKGILLPQVPIERGWDEREFLSRTCEKAGLSSTAWFKGGCLVKKFSGDIFAEDKPYGNVVKVELT